MKQIKLLSYSLDFVLSIKYLATLDIKWENWGFIRIFFILKNKISTFSLNIKGSKHWWFMNNEIL